MIDTFGLNANIVRAICNSLKNGVNHPYAIKNAISELITNNANFAEKFKQIADEHNIIIPQDYNI